MVGGVSVDYVHVNELQFDKMHIRKQCALASCSNLFMDICKTPYNKETISTFFAATMPTDFDWMARLTATLFNAYCEDVLRKITKAGFKESKDMRWRLSRSSSKIRLVIKIISNIFLFISIQNIFLICFF